MKALPKLKAKKRKFTSLLSKEPSLLTPGILIKHSQLLLLLLLMVPKLLLDKALSSGKEQGKNIEVQLHDILVLLHNYQQSLPEV